MSGGSWDYLYSKLEDAANRLKADNCPHRRALGKKMQLMAEDMHDIEWVDSCDYSPGDELKSIDTVLGWNNAPGLVLVEALELAKEQLKEFDKAIRKAEQLQNSTSVHTEKDQSCV